MKKWMLILSCLFLSIGFLFAQSTQITGTVVDDTGEPVTGASVVVKGTTTGTITDINGKFTISMPSGVKNLVVSLIGMNTIEVAAKQNVKIIMKDDEQLLEEVMVVAYGTAKKSAFTGSAKAVTASDIASASKESLDKALTGKVAGVRVGSATGDPGSQGEINIRGVGSISASKTPLYVVDGIPVKSDDDMSYYGNSQNILATINPQDIESMTVLKDAAAASLYGSRAANGVIIITTKAGKEGKTKVSYTGEFGWSGMAVDQYKLMNASQSLDYAREAFANYYMRLNGVDKETAYGLVESNNRLGKIFADPTGKTNTNWKDEVYKNDAFSQDHQVAISGGNAKTKFYTSLGFNMTDGIVIGSQFKRTTGRVNLDHKITNNITLGVRQMLTRTSHDGVRDQNDQAQGLGTSSPVGILFAMDPTATVKNEDGSYNKDAGWGKVSNPHLMLGGRGKTDEWIQSKIFRSLTNADLTIAFSDKVTFKTLASYDYIDNKHFEFWGKNSVNGSASSVLGLGSRYTYENKAFTSSSTLRYANTFAGVHNFDILGGFEAEKKDLLQIITVAKNYSTDKLPELANGQADNVSSATYGEGLVSYLATSNYNYDNRYYLSMSFRRDGSSRLGADNRWANFWSVSGAWRISKESFLEDMPLFKDLKVKASYGTNGNLPTDYYAHQRLYGFNGGYGNESAIYWSQFGNDNLGWEKSKNFNIGLDWNIYDKVNFSVEYYNKTTTDLLFQIPTTVATGFTSVWTNLGKLRNDGVEFEISSTNIKTKDFSWNTNFNLTYQRAIIKELPDDNADIIYGDGKMYIHRVDESMYSFYLPVWAGVNPETGDGQFWKDPADHSKGVVTKYSEAGKGIVGKALPDVIGGLTNTFSYKGIDLSFLITYQFGGSMFDYPGYFTHHDGLRIGSMNLAADVAGNYWKNPGDVVDYPKPVYSYASSTRWDSFSSRTIKSTDNIRMREISLGYNLNVPFIKQYVNNARVYFKTNNPFMIWSKEDGVDPDVSLNGYRQVDTPQLRSFVFGLSFDI